MNWRLGIGIALALLLAIFSAQNYQVVEVRLLFWKIEMSRAFLILGLFFLGLGSGWLLARVRHRSLG